MDACATLTQFSHNPSSVSLRDVIDSIFRLAQAGSQLQFSLDGYMDCSLCRKLLNQQSQPSFRLECRHQVHIECLKNRALQMSKALDPQQLLGLQCLACWQLISYSTLQEAFGNRWIEGKMAEISKQLEKDFQVEDRRRNQKMLQERVYECGVCIQECKLEEMVTFDCNHRFCKKCSEENIKAQLGEGKYTEEQIGCPECQTANISEQTLRYCVGDEMTMRIINFRHKHLKVEGLIITECKGYRQKKDGQLHPLLEPKENMTKEEQKKFDDDLETINRAIRRNQKPANIGEVEDCPGIFAYMEGDEGDQITCAVCGLKQCVKGCPVTHEGKTCEQYKESVKDNELEDGGIEMLRRNGLKLVKCPNPKCAALIDRISGCDWVKCRCGCEMCYICQLPWTGNCPHKNGHAPFDFNAFMARQR